MSPPFSDTFLPRLVLLAFLASSALSLSACPANNTPSNPVPTATPTPTALPTGLGTASPTPLPSASATALPTATPVPSAEPTAPISSPTPLPVSASATNALGMNFVRIDAGAFIMGSPSSEVGHKADEIQRSVSLTRAFLIQTTEVTQRQWKAVMGSNPSKATPENLDRPVESVSWDQVQDFIARLNQRGDGRYRLPTEAEWEYAARAGSADPYFFGPNARFLKDFAWFVETAGNPPQTQPVGKKRPNLFGLYDVIGNVSEYVSDNYTGEITAEAQVDPKGPATSAHRVYRDCHYAQPAEACRVAARHLIRPDFVVAGQIGFRLVRE
ncbi:MAG: formylglycine-generating enzyme family protein [Candidatus Sericytochromatia bacterium]